jgi:hypothetical protein
MKLLIATTLLLSGSLASAEGLKTVINSICASADQSFYTVDLTSPVVLPDSTTVADFHFNLVGLAQGSPLIDIVLSTMVA